MIDEEGRKAKKRAYMNAWRAANIEEARARDRARYAADPEKRRAQNDRWNADNNEAMKTYMREYMRKRRAADPEKARYEHRVCQKKRRAAKPEKTREDNRRWALANPDVRRALEHKRRARKAANGGSYTKQEWADRCAEYGGVCLRCQKPCKRFSVDHIIPLSRGGANWIWNIQPLCRSCNSSKSNRETVFYPPPWYSL